MSGVAAFSENALYLMILSVPFFTVNLTVHTLLKIQVLSSNYCFHVVTLKIF